MWKRRIYILAGAISVMLITLIIVQVVWLRSASDAEKKELQVRACRALERAGIQISKRNYCLVAYSKMYINPNEGFYIIRQKYDSSGSFTGKPDTVNIYISFAENGYKDTGMHVESAAWFTSPEIVEIAYNFRRISRFSKDFYKEKNSFIEKIGERKMDEAFISKSKIDSLLNMEAVDSIIGENLRFENIKSAYGFGFILDKNKEVSFAERVEDSARLLASPYNIHLFRGNKFMAPYKLAVILDEKSGIYRVNYWLFLSVAIILLLTFSFYAFLALYLRQIRLSEMKSDFINNLTHEFNTPMTNIELAVETLNGNDNIVDAKTRRILDIIATESARLRGNIERALQVSVLDEGEMHLHKERVDLVQLVNTVVSVYQIQCEALGGDITFAHNGSALVFVDDTHLLNCVVNLLDNSIKYRNGPPRITISVEEKGSDVVLTIADNGMGMSSETQKHIFEKFYRAHEGIVHNTKGFGLGLSYVKGIIDAHGGSVEVSAKLAHGAKFTIRLPQKEDNGNQ